MTENSLQGMTCPKCGSADWQMLNGWYLGLLGLGILGIGIILSLFLIGIPMVIVGLIMLIAAPFAGTGYSCKRCHKFWKQTKAKGPS